MPVAGERGQITQLPQGDHLDKIALSLRPNNTIRPDRSPCPTSAAKRRRNGECPKKITEHDRRETWTQRLTTRARASARSPMDTQTVTGGRTRWTFRFSIGT